MNRAIPVVSLLLAAAPLAGTEPLTLKSAVARALERAPELAVSRGAYDEAAAGARGAASAFMPEAFVSTTPGYATGMPVAVAGRIPAIASIEARQLLYDPRARAEVRLAQAKAEEASGAVARTRAETARAVVQLYAKCWADESLRRSAALRVETEEHASAGASALEREGRTTPLDAEKALLALARARQRLLDVTSDRDLDQRELRRLVGWPPNEPLVLAEEPLAALAPPSGDDLAVARAADAELASIAREEELTENARRLVTRAVQPTVAAEIQYARLTRLNNYDEYFKTFKADDFSVGVSVAIPLFTGGRTDSSVARMRAGVERVRAARLQREQTLETEVVKAQAEQTAAAAALSLAERARAIGAEGLRIVRLLEKEGRAQPDAVAQAERAAADGDEELAKATLRAATARAALLSARGDLLRTLVP